ncbi:hypothetical protein [Streptomyces sp. NPDC051016]|uniref:hypothetical protein n=1 Tax=Streptomyces sp. NPDC051016 TaxID=3365638 RepID=UPI00379AE8CB
MTISYGSTGTQSTHTNTITPTLVGSAGQLAVLQVVSGHPDDSIPSTPSGWILAGSTSGGGSTFASSAGPRRLTWFVRVLTGGDGNPTTAIPSGATGSLIIGRIVSLSRTAGTDWRWATSFGDDQTSGTGFAAAGTTALSWQSGDMAIIGYGVASNADSFSAEAIAVTGVTFGTLTERADAAVTTGYGASVALATSSVTAGTATLAPSLVATLASASVGIAGVLRVREASSDVNATPQSVFPPRNLVSVTGLEADDIVTATIYRQVGADRTVLRAANGIDVTGTDVLLRIDAEQPFGVSLNYAAELVDLYGNVWTAFSGPITSTVTSDVISDAIRGIGAAVKVESPLEWSRSREATKFNAGGRIIVVGKKRSAPSTTMTVRTITDADGDALNAVLDDLTEGVLLFRKQNSLSRLDGTYALTDDTESPNWYDQIRWFQLELQSTETWADVLEAAGFTLQDIADNFDTLQDLADFFTPGTLLDIALYDFGTV